MPQYKQITYPRIPSPILKFHSIRVLILKQGPPHGLQWTQLITKLAIEATNLKSLHVYFDAKPQEGKLGGGHDVLFARALTMLPATVKLEIGGYIAEWPLYLEERLGYKVWDEVETFRNVKAHFLGSLGELREYQGRLPDLKP